MTFLQGHCERTRQYMKQGFCSEHQIPALVMNTACNEHSTENSMLSTYKM